jgi:hypothetical protein
MTPIPRNWGQIALKKNPNNYVLTSMIYMHLFIQRKKIPHGSYISSPRKA